MMEGQRVTTWQQYMEMPPLPAVFMHTNIWKQIHIFYTIITYYTIQKRKVVPAWHQTINALGLTVLTPLPLPPSQMNPKTHHWGCPWKKRRSKEQGLAEQAQAPCPRSRSRNSDDADADTDDDTGTHELWDPHAGLKPSPLDDCASDANIEMENDLPYGADTELNSAMVDMIIDLDDGNEWDLEWLPLREWSKLDARKTGLISFASRLIRWLTCV
jgi:hypothetical protein